MEAMQLTWETVDAKAIYPDARYRADIGKREYRIFLDSKGEHLIYPDPDGPKAGEWWYLIGRETQARPLDWWIVLSSYPTLGTAKGAAADHERRWPQ